MYTYIGMIQAHIHSEHFNIVKTLCQKCTPSVFNQNSLFQRKGVLSGDLNRGTKESGLTDSIPESARAWLHGFDKVCDSCVPCFPHLQNGAVSTYRMLQWKT